MPEFFSVGEAARRIGVRARLVSYAIYEGRVDQSRFPLVAGRRLIPVDCLEELRSILGKREPVSV